MIALFLVFLAFLMLDPKGEQLTVFFRRTRDFFADYFNVAKMSVNRNPYWYGLDDPAPHEHGYPPLCYFIFFFLARFADYAKLSAFEAGFSTTGLTSAFFFTTIVVLSFFALLRYAYRKQGILGVLLPLCFSLSSVFLFSFERGNIIFLAVSLSMFFILAYRSKSRVVFEFALLALAGATALKGYPALFGMLLLFDKRFAASARCALYAIALIFLPFLFFKGGFENIPVWLHNISLNSEFYSTRATTFGFGLLQQALTPISEFLAQSAQLTSLLGTACKIFCVLCLLTSFFFECQWKRVLALGLAIVCLQTNSATYLGLYLFIGIVLFFSEKQHCKLDWAFLVLFIVFLNPVQIITTSQANLTTYAMGVSVDILLVWLTIDGIRNCARALAKKT